MDVGQPSAQVCPVALAENSLNCNKMSLQDQKLYDGQTITRKLAPLIQKKIQKQSPEKPAPSRNFKKVRKLAKKALEVLKVKIGAFSAQIEEDPTVVKDWFKKKTNDESRERIQQKCKEWLLKKLGELNFRQFNEIAQKYIKSEELEYNIGVLKKNPQYPDFLEAEHHFVLCKHVPAMETETPSSLVLIRLRVPTYYLTKKENTFVNERLYWDVEDQQTEDEIIRNLTMIILDLFNEIYPTQLQQLLYKELMVIVQLCYVQLIVQLENHIKIQSAWKDLFESCEQLYQESILGDGTISIKLQIKGRYEETIEWDTSYNLQQYEKFHYPSIQNFARDLVNENKLEPGHVTLIACQISTQINQFIERKLDKLASVFEGLSEEDPTFKEIKQKLKIGFRDNLEVIKRDVGNKVMYPQSQELQIYFKKNCEFLPPKVARYFGYQTKNERSEAIVDVDDIKQNESKFNLSVFPNEYLDIQLYRELQRGQLSKTIFTK